VLKKLGIVGFAAVAAMVTAGSAHAGEDGTSGGGGTCVAAQDISGEQDARGLISLLPLNAIGLQGLNNIACDVTITDLVDAQVNGTGDNTNS
jgi:hypothetical protein